MPTKHIDDATAAHLDDLYVRCVTLTQQPVKEVEVLRLAIMKGIFNINDDDILATLSAKDSVWQRLAEQTWAEVSAWWPAEAITADRFDVLATEHSETWQLFSAPTSRTAILDRLKQRLHEPFVYGLFESDNFGMSDEEIRASAERDAQLDVTYKQQLTGLQGRLYSTLSAHEKELIHCYSDRAGYVPDGRGDFLVELQLTEASK